MKKIFLVLAIILLLSCFVTIALAHPGKTDSQGGHTDHDTGEYHYHHGYPAHQHTFGRCPYDYHDNTEDDSYSSDYEASGSYYESSGTSDSREDSVNILFLVLSIVCMIVLLVLFCTDIIEKFKHNVLVNVLSYLFIPACIILFIALVMQPLITAGIIIAGVIVGKLIDKYKSKEEDNSKQYTL